MLAAWYLTLRYAICLSKSTNMATRGRWLTTKYFICYRYSALLFKILTIGTPIDGPWGNTLKQTCHFDELFFIACTGSCRCDNFRCIQWRKYHQNDIYFHFSIRRHSFMIPSVKITAYHFDRCLASTDAGTPVKFHSAYDSINTNLGGSKLRKILW